MPELPEVETVRRGIEPVLKGARFAHVDVRRPDLRWPFPENMGENLTGRLVKGVRRRSKYLLVDLDDENTLMIHLGMSGRILISGAATAGFHHDHPAIAKHDHVIFDMESGARLTFNDSRRFGAMDLFPTAEETTHWLMRDLGPEPLSNAFNAGVLSEKAQGRKTAIKAFLLDQRVVAGLGNIYVCEALFRAGISPLRPAGRISVLRFERLASTIRSVLQAAIEAGGSSLRDYRTADGDLGYFQHSFDVYDREGEPCRTEGCTGTIRRVAQSGRSTFYCPQCQR